VLSDEDRAWLTSLQDELWIPPDNRTRGERLADDIRKELGQKVPERPTAREQITREELYRALDLIEPTPLVVSLYCSGMFGGIGITLYEHETYIGTGAEPLLSISEQHLPRLLDRTVYEHMLGVEPRPQKKREAGGIRDDAWELFTKYALTPQNLEWCARYGIEFSSDRYRYYY
jgi:hypothetical protein